MDNSLHNKAQVPQQDALNVLSHSFVTTTLLTPPHFLSAFTSTAPSLFYAVR